MGLPLPRGNLLTLPEYEALPQDDRYFEEVSRGRLVREPRPGQQHGRTVAIIVHAIMKYVDEHPGCGVVYTESGFVLDEHPLVLRGPDVAFVRATRVPTERPRSFFHGPPDLAIEVVSPGNTIAALQEKVGEFLDAGALVVWVVDPEARSVVVHEPGRNPRVLHEDEQLEGGTLLPGLRWDIHALFPAPGA